MVIERFILTLLTHKAQKKKERKRKDDTMYFAKFKKKIVSSKRYHIDIEKRANSVDPDEAGCDELFPYMALSA